MIVKGSVSRLSVNMIVLAGWHNALSKNSFRTEVSIDVIALKHKTRWLPTADVRQGDAAVCRCLCFA